ncbi:ATP-binding protein [Corynebacterium sp. MNWGS58]|uniref:ATP-binding protein n=1 Tax=Corynebacterium sp. 102791.4 TaxID=3104612 RepID=UPI00351860D1
MYQGKAYLRQADGEYEIPASELRMIEVAKLHAEQEEVYDRRPVPGTTVEDLDDDLHQQFLRTARASIARLRETPETTLLRNLVVTNGEVLSIAGFYALGHFPQGPLPSLAITVAVRLPETERPRRTRNLATFYGPVPALLNQTMDWIEANIPQTQTYQESGHMRSVPVIPLAAIREAVANALIHRDLGPNTVEAGKAIDVRITPDRLIITSPGGLKNLTVAQLYSADFRRIEVNQHLYRLAKLLTDTDGNRIIEGEGGGVNAMFELCESAGLPQPKIINTGVKVTVIFFFPKQSHTSGDAPIEAPAPKTVPHNGAELENNASLGNGIQVSDDQYLRSLGKNVPKIVAAAQRLAAESTPLTPPGHSAGVSTGDSAEFSFSQLVAESGLSNSQVRYGLSPFLEHKIIVRKGGQGKKATTYQLGKRG